MRALASKELLSQASTNRAERLEHIQECFPKSKISLLDACGITAASKEATSFAFMGLECLLGRPLIITKIEVQEPAVMGKITPGRNYMQIIRQVANFHQALKKNGLEAPVNESSKKNDASSNPWLPPVRDLRIVNNKTREKELKDIKCDK